MSRKQIDEKCLALLEDVGIPAPKQRLGEYPHQLSGGMRQRVMIAMALACEPDVLIADEPTTALDVTIQAQILDLMERLKKDHGMAMIFITHDLGVIAEIADHVAVMYGGRIVESAPVEELFKNPSHPYTKGLLSSIPRLDGASKVRLETIEGMVPSLHDMPEGCRFENRCPYSDDGCTKQRPPVTKIGPSHMASCLRLGMLDGEGANA
jgi:peptide/nickel transport system ATP-binding protein